VKYTGVWGGRGGEGRGIKITVPIQVKIRLKLNMPFQIYTIPRYPNMSVIDK